MALPVAWLICTWKVLGTLPTLPFFYFLFLYFYYIINIIIYFIIFYSLLFFLFTWNGFKMFFDLDWPTNASSPLSASAELLVRMVRCATSNNGLAFGGDWDHDSGIFATAAWEQLWQVCRIRRLGGSLRLTIIPIYGEEQKRSVTLGKQNKKLDGFGEETEFRMQKQQSGVYLWLRQVVKHSSLSICA